MCCDYCKNILIGFQIEHPINQCILKRGQYCTHCASYGHTAMACNAKMLANIQNVSFLEQLIPYHDLKKHGIKSQTPIIMNNIYNDQCQLIEVVDNAIEIKKYLYSIGIITPTKSKEKLIKLLTAHANKKNTRIVFTSVKQSK